MRTYFLNDMTAAYIEAAYFTDGEENEDQEFTTDFKNAAYKACYSFEDAANTLEIDLRARYSAEQLGHDLWLTRNRHGAGFWDRPEVYGEHTDIFTALAHAQGSHYAEFI
jgi:hypothetical protein